MVEHGQVEVHMRNVGTLLVLAFILVTMTACNGGSGESPTAPTYPSGKPTGVSADAGDRSATISWNKVSGAAGYYVYMSTNGTTFQRYEGGLIFGSSYSVFNLVNGQTYYFGVSAVGEGGWETSIAYPGGSPTAEPVVPGPIDPGLPDYIGVPPPAPRNLQGEAYDSSCGLRWERYATTIPDFDFFRIYRRSNIGGTSIWAVLEDTFTDNYGFDGFYGYLDEDLENGATYSYRLTAFDDEELESDYSNVITLQPEDFVPEPLQNPAIFVNPGRIVLEWDIPTAPDIKQFAIERIEGIDPVTGAEIIVRFLINLPTQGPGNPEQYAGGLALVWIDLERNRIVALDGAVTVGIVYSYRLSAIDESDQEGPPIQVTAPIAVY
jgi:hypothetical protein